MYYIVSFSSPLFSKFYQIFFPSKYRSTLSYLVANSVFIYPTPPLPKNWVFSYSLSLTILWLISLHLNFLDTCAIISFPEREL